MPPTIASPPSASRGGRSASASFPSRSTSHRAARCSKTIPSTEGAAMFGSDMLDVAIGIAFVYLLVSLLCSAIVEAAEAILKRRSQDLERGIGELLRDPKLVTQVYNHPLVNGLFRGTYTPGMRNLPSY